MFQADVLMAKRFKIGKSDMIASSDGDFLMHVGKESVQIKEIMYEIKHKKIKSMTLSMSSD